VKSLGVLIAIVAVAATTGLRLCKIHLVDASGAPIAKVLVIVKSLQGSGEIARYLTDASGGTPQVEFGEGLYRIIVTCPYGLCQTVVREVLGSNLGDDLKITVPLKSTDSDGELIGQHQIVLRLTSREGGPVSGIKVLVRDPEAKWESWCVTDADGHATIKLPSDPAVVIILAGKFLSVYDLSTNCSTKENSDGSRCVEIRRTDTTVSLDIR
jgi:hypothetical protein